MRTLKTLSTLCALVCVLGLGLLLAACPMDSGGPGGGGGGGPGDTPASLAQTLSSDKVVIKITETNIQPPARAATPAAGNYYWVFLDGVLIDQGTITVKGDKITFSGGFTLTRNGDTYTLGGAIPNSQGSPISGPRIFTSGGSSAELTGDVSFLNTESNSAAIGMAITGTGTAVQHLSISVGERSVTYFAAAKSAAQTISIGGTHAALVSQAASGTVDGSAASGELSVFTVDTSAFDLLFSGGSRAFTLMVAEAGKDSITVHVTVTVSPEKTGVAVYRVTRSGDRDLPAYAAGDPARAEAWARMGSLERIRGIENYEIVVLAQDFVSGSTADGLLDGLAWVDRNAQSDEEYLIRVEQSEELPNICLSFPGQERIMLRLRSDDGTERILKHNLGTLGAGNNVLKDATNTQIGTIQSFFILRGDLRNGENSKDIKHSLHLETGITFDGHGATRAATNFTNLLEMGHNCRLVMLAGSKITNMSSLSASGSTMPVVYIINSGAYYDIGFYMYGGAITDNYIRSNHEAYGPVKLPVAASFYASSVFFKYGGSITNNHKFGANNNDANKVVFGNTVSAGVNPIYLEPDTVYILPEFN